MGPPVVFLAACGVEGSCRSIEPWGVSAEDRSGRIRAGFGGLLMTERRFLLVNGALAGTVAAAVLLGLRWASLRPAPDSVDLPTAARERVNVSEVASLLRALKLVTVEITAPVKSDSVDRSWRGDVEASVTAPARLYYGVDMSRLAESGIGRDPLSGGWIVRVPEPRRLAVEVFSTDEQPTVRVGGTRFRDIAGEYHLGQARLKLYERAHELGLTREQAATIEEFSRQQIQTLVRALVGKEVSVRVEFEGSELTVGEERPGDMGGSAGSTR